MKLIYGENYIQDQLVHMTGVCDFGAVMLEIGIKSKYRLGELYINTWIR